MSIPFSRSTRSLNLDSFRPALIGLALAILTLLALIAWFFLAHVTLYQTSDSANLKQDGQIIAAFPANTFSRLKPGQTAILRLGQAVDQRQVSVPAVVFDTQGGNEQVVLIITDVSALPGAITEDTPGRVDVEVEHITPAELLLRASGKFLTRGGAPTDTQPTSIPQQP
jgi:hypothetical protein